MKTYTIVAGILCALIIIPVVGLFLCGLLGSIADEIIKWARSRKGAP